MTKPAVVETIAELRATIAACRETMDKIAATVQEMALIEFKAEAMKRGELMK